MKKKVLILLSAFAFSVSAQAEDVLDTFVLWNHSNSTAQVKIIPISGNRGITKTLTKDQKTEKIPLLTGMTGPVVGVWFVEDKDNAQYDCPGMSDKMDGTTHFVTLNFDPETNDYWCDVARI